MLHFHLFVASLNSNSHDEDMFYLKTTQSALHAVQSLSYYQLAPHGPQYCTERHQRQEQHLSNLKIHKHKLSIYCSECRQNTNKP